LNKIFVGAQGLASLQIIHIHLKFSLSKELTGDFTVNFDAFSRNGFESNDK